MFLRQLLRKTDEAGRYFIYTFYFSKKDEAIFYVLFDPNIISQGHNLFKLQYISLEEVKSVSFQPKFQSEAIESNLSRLYLKLFTPRLNFSPSKISLTQVKK